MRVDELRDELASMVEADDASADSASAVRSGRARVVKRRGLAVVSVVALAVVVVAVASRPTGDKNVISTPSPPPTTLPTGAPSLPVAPFTPTITASSAEEAWICADPMLHTADGGATWQKINWRADAYRAAKDLRACAAVPTDAWVVSQSGNYATVALIQGGSDIGAGSAIGIPHLHDGATITQATFVDRNTGWILARTPGDGPHHGFLYRSTEGGIRFTLVSGNAPVNGVQFVSANEGWGIGDGDVGHTNDGGATWSRVDIGVTVASGLSLTIVDGRIIVRHLFPGNGFTISDDGGGSWTSRQGPGDHRTEPWLFDAIDRSDWVMTGADRSLWVSTDAGASWRLSATLPFAPTSVSFANASDGWIMRGSAIAHTSDSGRTWSNITPQAKPVQDWSVGLAGVPTECPKDATTRPPAGADAPTEARQAALDFVRTTRGWTDVDVRGVDRVSDHSANSQFAGIFQYNVPRFCGGPVARASYSVEIFNPSITQDNSRDTALVVGHFAEGWRVWGYYR